MHSASPAPAHAFAPPRVAPNLKHAFGGIFRLTLRRYATPGHWITLAVMLAVLALMLLGNVGRTDARVYFGWASTFYLALVVPAMAFLTAAGAWRDEMKASTTDYVLTRPVPRWAFLLFRYVSQLICTQLDFLLAFGVVIGLGFVREIPGLLAAVPLLLLAQVLMITAFSAFGFFSATLTSRYVIVGIVYGAVVEVGLGQVPTQLARLSLTQQILGMLQPLTQISMAQNPLGPFGTTLIALVVTLGMLGLAALFFVRRELIGKNEA